MAQSNPANVIKFLHVIENLKVADRPLASFVAYTESNDREQNALAG